MVIAACIGIDARGPAEFAQHNDHGLFQLPTDRQIFDQRSQCRIHYVTMILHSGEVVVVGVKPTAIYLHEPHASFHQTSGQ